jgi:hypothetical protein
MEEGPTTTRKFLFPFSRRDSAMKKVPRQVLFSLSPYIAHTRDIRKKRKVVAAAAAAPSVAARHRFCNYFSKKMRRGLTVCVLSFSSSTNNNNNNNLACLPDSLHKN